MNKAQVVTFCLPCMPLLFNEIILNPYLQEFSYPKNPKMYVCDTILVTVLKMQPIMVNPVVRIQPHPVSHPH